jgi:hypothetical protein
LSKFVRSSLGVFSGSRVGSSRKIVGVAGWGDPAGDRSVEFRTWIVDCRRDPAGWGDPAGSWTVEFRPWSMGVTTGDVFDDERDAERDAEPDAAPTCVATSRPAEAIHMGPITAG